MYYTECFFIRVVLPLPPPIYAGHTDGVVQGCSISGALAMEILQSCTEPSIQYYNNMTQWRRINVNMLHVNDNSTYVSIACSGWNQCSILLTFCKGILRWPVYLPHRGAKIRTWFPCCGVTKLLSSALLWNSIAILIPVRKHIAKLRELQQCDNAHTEKYYSLDHKGSVFHAHIYTYIYIYIHIYIYIILPWFYWLRVWRL